MERLIHFVEKAILLLIAGFTVYGVALEMFKVVSTGRVELTDLLLMFIYAEVLGMVGAFYASREIPINIPIFIARRRGDFIEPAGATPWQVVAMIRYRSKRDFVRTFSAVMDKNVMLHKWAAISVTHVFPVQPLFSLISLRLTGLLLRRE